MNSLGRRHFLALGALGICSLGVSCKKQPTRTSVLSSLASTIGAAQLQATLADSRALDDAVAKFTQAPDESTLMGARGALKNAILTWERTYPFRNGPLIETNAFLRSTFWPPRANAIAEVISNKALVDAALVDALGVDVKGLFALEYLLFQRPAQSAWEGPARTRALQLTRAFSRDVLRHAEDANAASGRMGFAEAFASGGQDSLNKLVDQMIGTMETIAVERLDHVRELAARGALQARDVLAGASGVSHLITRSWLEVTEQIYLNPKGEGLSALVYGVAPAIDAKVKTSFLAARRALGALSVPIEQVARAAPARLEVAARRVRGLEVSLRTDLASALSVTLTFTSSDGD